MLHAPTWARLPLVLQWIDREVADAVGPFRYPPVHMVITYGDFIPSRMACGDPNCSCGDSSRLWASASDALLDELLPDPPNPSASGPATSGPGPGSPPTFETSGAESPSPQRCQLCSKQIAPGVLALQCSKAAWNMVNADMLAKAHTLMQYVSLRRLKSDVEVSLPPKHELKLPVPMSEFQRHFYGGECRQKINI